VHLLVDGSGFVFVAHFLDFDSFVFGFVLEQFNLVVHVVPLFVQYEFLNGDDLFEQSADEVVHFY